MTTQNNELPDGVSTIGVPTLKVSFAGCKQVEKTYTLDEVARILEYRLYGPLNCCEENECYADCVALQNESIASERNWLELKKENFK